MLAPLSVDYRLRLLMPRQSLVEELYYPSRSWKELMLRSGRRDLPSWTH